MHIKIKTYLHTQTHKLTITILTITDDVVNKNIIHEIYIEHDKTET